MGKNNPGRTKGSAAAIPSEDSISTPLENLCFLADRMPWKWIVGAATAFLLLISRAPLFGLILIDDSFITYTYSKNLVEHGQLVFNLGEHVLATTTPLYAFLLSLFVWIGADLFYAAPVFNLILDGLTAFFAFLVIRRIYSERCYIIYSVFAVLFFLQPYQIWSSAGGMETSLYILLTLMIVWAALSDRWISAGIIAALLIMTRPDGLVIVVVVLAYHIVVKRAIPVISLVAFIVTLSPWLIFATVYYGSPVPAGVSAKLIHSEDIATPILEKFKKIYYFHHKSRSILLFAATFIPSVMGLCGMGWAVLSGIKRRKWELLIFVVFFILFNCAFMFPSSYLGWFWYYVPLYIPLYMYAGYICAEVIGRFRPSSFLLVVWIIVVISVNFFRYLPFEYQKFRVRSLFWDQGIRQPSLWIEKNTPPEATVMCKTPGISGFYSNRRVIDPLGIISPELLPYYPGDKKAEMEILRIAKPDYFISWDISPDKMREEYDIVQEYRMEHAGRTYKSIWLYKRSEEHEYNQSREHVP